MATGCDSSMLNAFCFDFNYASQSNRKVFTSLSFFYVLLFLSTRSVCMSSSCAHQSSMASLLINVFCPFFCHNKTIGLPRHAGLWSLCFMTACWEAVRLWSVSLVRLRLHQIRRCGAKMQRFPVIFQSSGLAATVVGRLLLTPEAEPGSTLCRRTLCDAAAASHMSWHLTQTQHSALQDSAVMLISR